MNTIAISPEPTPQDPEPTPEQRALLDHAAALEDQHQVDASIWPKCPCGNNIHSTGARRNRCDVCLSEDAVDRIERLKDDASKQENFRATHDASGRVRRFTLETYEGATGWN